MLSDLCLGKVHGRPVSTAQPTLPDVADDAYGDTFVESNRETLKEDNPLLSR